MGTNAEPPLMLVSIALMHEVYSRSHCNLSASASTNSTEGLFRSRDPRTLNITQVNLCVADLDASRNHVQCDIYNFFFWTHNISQCIINKRAWVTQERLLAPRMLHFGHSQLLWEYMEHDACKSYPDGLPDFYHN
jgi:hypothetical protein